MIVTSTHRADGDVWVTNASGELDLESAAQLERASDDVVAACPSVVALNLADVTRLGGHSAVAGRL